jgi:LmbE family N-acetylglucosaminyl deacetylase
VVVLVAHPDDEVLWCGGLLLAHRDWRVFVGCLCRGSDPDRAPKFFRVLEKLGAQGAMADLDDGPEQSPLPPQAVRDTLLSLAPEGPYDLVLTHGPRGEYTRHRRHEEVSAAVEALCREGLLKCQDRWQFAYEDGGGAFLPRAAAAASLRFELSPTLRAEKAALVTDLYGFSSESWEARAIPWVEAFWTSDPRGARAPRRSGKDTL